MQQININELKPHPQNDFFFDDIVGENWNAFLESIKTSGVIEPIIATQKKITVSGHQRIRACKELGITTIPCDIRIYETDDKLLKDLIETNLRQRGLGNANPIKLGRCIVELERIYGIHNGNQLGNNFPAKTQENLASELGLEARTLRNYKKLTELIPELADLIDTGIVTPTTALSIVRNLTPNDQEQFVSSMDITKKITQKNVQQYIDKIKQLESQPPKTIEKIIDNTDYSSIEKKTKELQQLQNKYNIQSDKINILNDRVSIFESNSDKYKKLTSEIDKLTKEKSDIARRIVAVTSISGLTEKIDFMLKNELAPIKYSQALQEASGDEIVAKNLSNIIYSVQRWCDEMKNYLPNDDKNNVIDMEEI